MLQNALVQIFLDMWRTINSVMIRFENLAWKLRYFPYRKIYTIHPDFRFNGGNIELYGDGEIILNKNSYIGSFSTLQASLDTKIEIGVNCQISHNVRIYTSTAIADQDFSNIIIESKKGNVIIENNVWIGANVFINPGIKIGENAIIGANSVVTKDVNPFEIIGGVPAKLIRIKSILGNKE
jgi:maltose O-acetyltransferase